MTKPKVVIYRSVDPTGASHQQLESAGCEVVLGGITSAGPDPTTRDASVLMGATYKGIIDAHMLDAFPQLRLISKYTIGYDDVDLNAATARGVLVTHCPTEANVGGVAEGTVALILALLKKVRERDSYVKGGGWRDSALTGTYLGARSDGYPGITIGIVGLGRIGRRLAELFAPWRVRLLACDPFVDDEVFSEYSLERAELSALLEEADVVSLHCDLNDGTRGLIDADRLALMKPTAVLVNTARGPIVELDALCDAIESEKLAGAALDVLPEEPPQANARILGLGDRVLLFPHMVAANQGGTLSAAIPWATEATLSALRGDLPERIVNDDAVKAWTARFGGKSLL